MNYVSEQTIVRRVELDAQEVGPDLYAFRRTTTNKYSKPTGDLKVIRGAKQEYAPEGLIDSKNLEKMVSGKDYKTKGEFAWLSSETLEALRCIPPGNVLNTDHIEEVYERNNIYTSLITNGGSLDNVIDTKMLIDSHMLVNIHGDVLPVAVMFDYMRGVTDSVYDLVKMAPYLLGRDDVDVIVEHFGTRSTAKTEKECMFNIPYYNGGGQAIQFIWKPTTEDYRRVWATCGGKYPANRFKDQVFELDVLGLKQFLL